MDEAGAFNLNIANTVMIFAGTLVSWLCKLTKRSKT